MKKAIVLLAILMLASSVYAISAPPTYHTGQRLYNYYWDLMGEQGIQNGSVVNMSNFSTIDPYPYTVFDFGASDVGANRSINISATESFSESLVFRNAANWSMGNGIRIINITYPHNWSANACARFVTEVNTNSSLVRAEGCSGNTTKLIAKVGNKNWTYHNMSLSTNLSGASFPSVNTTVEKRYVDVTGNATGEDLVFRSYDNTYTLRDRFSVRANASIGAGLVFNEMAIPISDGTPAGATNATFFINSSGVNAGNIGVLMYYYAGTVRYSNGTQVTT